MVLGRCLLVVILVSQALSATVTGRPAADKVFKQLQTLVGDWEAKTSKGSVIKLSYRRVSAGSALVETFATPSGRQTLTIYHMDGSYVMATHYCAQGNQPRLRLDKSSTETKLVFVFLDATNLASPTASHMHRLEVEFVDPDHFTKSETYRKDGKEETDVLKFSRVHPKSSAT